MCGRIVDLFDPEQLVELYHVVGPLRSGIERPPRYNLKPTQPIRAVRLDADGRRELTALRWGLIPPWSKEAKSPLPGNILINAKAEGIAINSMWRGAFKNRRCLMPVTGFYEWKKLDPAGKRKQPHYIHFADGRPMVFAGLWETWHAGADDEIQSGAMATVAPTEEFLPYHHRQVAILHTDEMQDAWLDPDTQPDKALALLQAPPPGLLRFRPVGNAVNVPGHDAPDCLAEAPPTDALPPPLVIRRPRPKPVEDDSQADLF